MKKKVKLKNSSGELNRKKGSGKKVVKKKKFYLSRKFWVPVLIVFIVLLLLFFTNFYLYYNYMIGNDVIVRLNLENIDLSVFRGESINVSFESSIVANPFCSVSCNYNFRDLSDGVDLDSGNFIMKTIEPFSSEYTITAPGKGAGQKLFRYDVSCVAVPSFLCFADDLESMKSTIVTFNYHLTDEDENMKLGLESDYSMVDAKLNFISSNVAFYDSVSSNFSNVDFDDEMERIVLIKTEIIGLNRSLSEFEAEWESQEYTSLFDKMEEIKSDFLIIEKRYDNLIIDFDSKVYKYNELVFSLSEMISFVNENLENNFSSDVLIDFSVFVESLGNYSDEFYSKDSLSNKAAEIGDLNESYNFLVEEIKWDFGGNSSYEGVFNFGLPSLIKLELSTDFTGRILNSFPPVCCFEGICKECCPNSCSSDLDKFPILFIHGHDFSSDVSAEHNLNSFSFIQRDLEEKYGVIDFGSSLMNIPEEATFDVWGRVNNPISVRSSYYFDSVHSGEGGEIDILQAKRDNLDTYALRLNDIVNTLRIETNREKVSIVAFSMGGLVVRRYLQVFGEDKVERVVLINTPNHGVSGNVNNLCGFFGSKDECDDLAEDSFFIRKLNLQNGFSFPTYNIVSVGCNMEGENGDGVVLNRSAYLPWANNFYIEGDCDDFAFEYLHNDVLDVTKYPNTTDIIADFLNL